MTKDEFPPELLRTVFNYEPEMGLLTWRSGRLAGKKAGHTTAIGYVQLSIGNRNNRLRVFAHQVAWAYMTGRWATRDIDHINNCKSDNRFHNLRELSRTLNQQNQVKGHANSQCGLLGVVPNKKTGKFMARIHVNGKSKQVGTFGTPDEAHAAYIEAKRRLHPANTL